jgi:LPXTG-motif cell wall-anchored protein
MKIALYILAGIVIAALGLIVLYRKRKLAESKEKKRWEEALHRAHLGT